MEIKSVNMNKVLLWFETHAYPYGLSVDNVITPVVGKDKAQELVDALIERGWWRGEYGNLFPPH